jgi:hypothetical protein
MDPYCVETAVRPYNGESHRESRTFLERRYISSHRITGKSNGSMNLFFSRASSFFTLRTREFDIGKHYFLNNARKTRVYQLTAEAQVG